MRYIYVFDYSFDKIYEIPISEKDYDEYKGIIESYLYRFYNIKSDTTSYMVSNNKLEIEIIDKINQNGKYI